MMMFGLQNIRSGTADFQFPDLQEVILMASRSEKQKRHNAAKKAWKTRRNKEKSNSSLPVSDVELAAKRSEAAKKAWKIRCNNVG